MHRPTLTTSSLQAACLAVAATLLLTSATGCAVVKAARQPAKKNLSVLSPGVPRTNVIAELGAPIWTEERDGATADVFAFKQGYSKHNKAARVFGHAALDVVTGGLWEVVGTPAEVIADGADVKVEVCYDEDYRVESINVIEGQKAVDSGKNVARRGLFKREPRAELAKQKPVTGPATAAAKAGVAPPAARTAQLDR